jgi:hypothetical protein
VGRVGGHAEPSSPLRTRRLARMGWRCRFEPAPPSAAPTRLFHSRVDVDEAARGKDRRGTIAPPSAALRAQGAGDMSGETVHTAALWAGRFSFGSRSKA